MSLAGRSTNAPKEYSPFTHKTASVSEAATANGVSTKTIWRWCAQDRVYFFRTASGRLRIYLDPVPRGNTQSETSPSDVGVEHAE